MSNKFVRSNSQLTEIPQEAFEDDNLGVLDVRFNDISIIPEEIKKVSNLESLNLRSNSLRSFAPQAVWPLKNLRTLDIGKNRIKEMYNLNKVQFKDSLEEFHLDENKLDEFPGQLCYFKNLKILNVSRNNLKRLPYALGHVSNLTDLNAAETQLTVVYTSITRLTNLTHLNLSGNNISSLPVGMEKLTKLKILNLKNNALTSLSDDVTKLENLEELILSDNRLRSIPGGMSNMKGLQRLSLSNNPIKDVSVLKDLDHLKLLHLSDCLISILPDLSKLRDLEHLNLSGNSLSDLTNITKATNLQELDLSRNGIKTLPQKMPDLALLKHLDISGNDVENIDMISGLSNLKSLTLKQCKISTLPCDISQVASLEHLDIACNQLTDMCVDFPISMKSINVSNNGGLTTLPNNITKLRSLEKFVASNTGIDALPENFATSLTNLVTLELDETNLRNPPPQIFRRGLEEMRRYEAQRHPVTTRERQSASNSADPRKWQKKKIMKSLERRQVTGKISILTFQKFTFEVFSRNINAAFDLKYRTVRREDIHGLRRLENVSDIVELKRFSQHVAGSVYVTWEGSTPNPLDKFDMKFSLDGVKWDVGDGQRKVRHCSIESNIPSNKMNFVAVLIKDMGGDNNDDSLQIQAYERRQRQRNREITERELLSVAKNIDSGWKDLSIDLGFRKSDNDRFQRENSTVNQQIFSMFVKWKQKKGTRATVPYFCSELERCGVAEDKYSHLFNCEDGPTDS
ncbi:leucine-rich repeat protein soc-2-like [Ptychodera flava]|uniref:leucine-rich repeat protein soc-2-like n=1 Tax=Ptychodera flava TaxID=63121 RepID=UPI003969C16F